MRNGQNKRMRGRNRKGGGHHQNPLSRMYESNGQDVKIRGTASHIAEKYLQLARDAQSSGDTIASENYYQHAEHYFRLIAAAQEQLRQTQPYYQPQQGDVRGNASDDDFDDGEGDQPSMGGEPFAPREPQQFYPREQQHQPQQYQPQQQPQPQHYQQRPQHNQQPADNDGDVERLPSFITGGQPQPAPQNTQGGQHSQGANGQNSQNGQNGYDGSPDRFPLHRRRRRHRSNGPRDQAMDHSMSGDGGPQGGSTDE
ncbi:MAG TPA: DUF4167 domain-containing protein [Xanthobacteraceae bacterium]|jgi:hypothetical protein|nr:DUF4167 domain-containing protein [Xanthobacteraceae bacterium]